LADVVYGRVRTTDPDKRPGPARLRARCAAACAAVGSRLRSERGSALIEVMVGAVVLSIATVGLLNGIDGAQSAGGKNKARSVAAALAEQDIERMRAMPVTQLAGYNNTRTVTVRGVNYTVVSKGTWAVDQGGPISCSNISRPAANIRIVSEVTSNATKGVVDQVSLVTPPPGTYATGEGRAIVKVADKDGDPVQGMTVSLAGTASFSGTTNSLGCAVFSFIPIGNYTEHHRRDGDDRAVRLSDLPERVPDAGQHQHDRRWLGRAAEPGLPIRHLQDVRAEQRRHAARAR
jgi:Tfp pilus assembly protein PilV